MVASAGFSTDAARKARHYGVETYTLHDARRLDWNRALRVTTWELLFPLSPTFTPADKADTAGFEPKPMSMADPVVQFNGIEHGAVQLLAQLGLDLAARGTKLPVSVKLDLPAGAMAGQRGADWEIPVVSLESVIGYVHVRKTAALPVPDNRQSFVYSDLGTESELVAKLDLDEVRRGYNTK
jgi:hypothetical protein